MQDNYIHNVNILIDRLKKFYKLKTDADLCVMLGIQRATLSNWKSRGAFDFELVFTKCNNLDVNFLVHGKRSQQNGAVDETIDELLERIKEKDMVIGVLRKQIELSENLEKSKKLNKQLEKDLAESHKALKQKIETH